ncbi:hypothetical protein B0H14DRAFT_2622492 [Mycena olivaceomarginata]|nr:hypothetical protein B0H14DRAFT_2622492 [Mycena olivaceomarginata]
MTTSTRPITRAQNLKVGKGKVGQLQADSSAEHLANEHEKLKKASPRRSQRLKPQHAQHIQGRAGKEPACATPDDETKVPVGSGVPETAMQNGTPNAQPSIKHKVSGTRAMKSHTHNHSVTATEQTVIPSPDSLCLTNIPKRDTLGPPSLSNSPSEPEHSEARIADMLSLFVRLDPSGTHIHSISDTFIVEAYATILLDVILDLSFKFFARDPRFLAALLALEAPTFFGFGLEGVAYGPGSLKSAALRRFQRAFHPPNGVLGRYSLRNAPNMMLISTLQNEG